MQQETCCRNVIGGRALHICNMPPLCPAQVYEKKVSSLANFNLEGRAASAGKVNALASNPKVSQLRLPKVGSADTACQCA